MINDSEKVFKISSVFLCKNEYINNNISDIVKEVENKLNAVTKEILKSELHEDSKQVAVMLAGYIAKTLVHVLSASNTKLVDNESEIEHRNIILNRNSNSIFIFLKIY